MSHHRAASPIAHRPRFTTHVGTAVVLMVALLLGACAPAETMSGASASGTRTPVSAPATEPAPATAVAQTQVPTTVAPTTPVPPTATEVPPTEVPLSPLAALVQPLAPAALASELAIAEEPTRTVVSLSIPAIGVTSAPIIPVGVNADDLSFEVPPASEVGWYKHGPQPGAVTGSAVLAAHIAFDGEDGVFRHLDDVEAGDEIIVTWSDGTTDSFTAGGTETYDKTELPDSLWAEDGGPQLVLITCGGVFNRSRSSYESNVVVVAT